MIWIAAYVVIACLFALVGLQTGGFQRREQLAADVATCVLWPAAVALVVYARFKAWLFRRGYR